MSAGYARQAKRVMSAECLSSVCLNLLDSYPRIKALHFHQNYVAPPHGSGTNIESFFHIRWGIESQCSCSQSYAVLANRIFVTGQALSCICIAQVTPSGADGPNFRKPCGEGFVRSDVVPMGYMGVWMLPPYNYQKFDNHKYDNYICRHERCRI